MTTTIEHPAFHIDDRGLPTKENVGDRTVPIDLDGGTFSVADEAEATAVMDRLERTYGVEYNDNGTIGETNAIPATAGAGDDSETEFDVLDGTVEEIESAVESGEYDTVLGELADAESESEDRAGVADAIEQRRETIVESEG